jgi:hypothetical protein
MGVTVAALSLAPQPGDAADGTDRPADRTIRLKGPVRHIVPGRSPGPVQRSAVRSWPLLVLAAPAAAEVWSGWVGIAARTGFGLVSPLPGIWPSLHIDTTITLPVGVEAYAAYALRAWLAPSGAVSQRTRRFARRSTIFSFMLGGAGQVAYHLLEQAGITRAPWAVTTIVSCLPVLVLAMGTALAHMLHADATSRSAGPPGQDTACIPDEPGPGRRAGGSGTGPPRRTAGTLPAGRTGPETGGPHPAWKALADADVSSLIAGRLIAAGQPVSRRSLRADGVHGSNSALGALARRVNEELARSAHEHRVAASPT